jgi:hypothetical protein
MGKSNEQSQRTHLLERHDPPIHRQRLAARPSRTLQPRTGAIPRKEGDGSKSEKLAKALEHSQAIIIVTMQTFSYVLKAIENSLSLNN